MALNAIDSKIQKAITSVNAGDEHQLQMCGYLQAMRGRADTYIGKAQPDISMPVLIQFIEDKDLMLPHGETERTTDFYLSNPQLATNTNPEVVRGIHDKLDDLIYAFYRKLQDEGLRPKFIGQRERLIEQIAAWHDVGIMFQMTMIIDARC